jgi:hypothetical protein
MNLIDNSDFSKYFKIGQLEWQEHQIDDITQRSNPDYAAGGRLALEKMAKS